MLHCPAFFPLPSCLQSRWHFQKKVFWPGHCPGTTPGTGAPGNHPRGPAGVGLAPSTFWPSSAALHYQSRHSPISSQFRAWWVCSSPAALFIFLLVSRSASGCHMGRRGSESPSQGGDKPLASHLLRLPGSSWSWGLGTKLIIKVGCFCQTSAEGWVFSEGI